MAQTEHIGPRVLGTYEMELHAWWNDISRCRFNQIIDVGAQFGFYAIGLALTFPETDVVAFDPDWWARSALQEMMTVNRTSRVSIRPLCDPAWLRENLRENVLIV